MDGQHAMIYRTVHVLPREAATMAPCVGGGREGAIVRRCSKPTEYCTNEWPRYDSCRQQYTGLGPNNAALSRTCCIMPYTLQILAQSGGGRSIHFDSKKAAPIFTSAFTELRAILQSGAYSFILAFRPA